MSNLFKGILYTGLAGIAGIGGYMLGKYKYMGGKISMTMIGLALVLYTPRGCDVVETYIKENAAIERTKINGLAAKDSIDAIVNFEKQKDSTLYLKEVIKNVSNTSKHLEKTYNGLIKENEKWYNQLLQQNEKQYHKTLNGVIKQNEIMKTDLDNLKNNISSNSVNKNTFEDKKPIRNISNIGNKSDAEYNLQIEFRPDASNNLDIEDRINKNSKSGRSSTDNYSAPISIYTGGKITSVKTTENEYIEDRILPDGKKVVLIYKLPKRNKTSK